MISLKIDFKDNENAKNLLDSTLNVLRETYGCNVFVQPAQDTQNVVKQCIVNTPTVYRAWGKAKADYIQRTTGEQPINIFDASSNTTVCFDFNSTKEVWAAGLEYDRLKKGKVC